MSLHPIHTVDKPSPPQAAWFADSRGASPTPAMLEDALSLLRRAWRLDPDRRAYQEVRNSSGLLHHEMHDCRGATTACAGYSSSRCAPDEWDTSVRQ